MKHDNQYQPVTDLNILRTQLQKIREYLKENVWKKKEEEEKK